MHSSQTITDSCVECRLIESYEESDTKRYDNYFSDLMFILVLVFYSDFDYLV